MSLAGPLRDYYRRERDGLYEARDVQEAVEKAGSLSALRIVEDKQQEKEGS